MLDWLSFEPPMAPPEYEKSPRRFEPADTRFQLTAGTDPAWERGASIDLRLFRLGLCAIKIPHSSRRRLSRGVANSRISPGLDDTAELRIPMR